MSYWDRQIEIFKKRRAIIIPMLIAGAVAIVLSVLALIYQQNSLFLTGSRRGFTVFFLILTLEQLIYERKRAFIFLFFGLALFNFLLSINVI